MQNCEFDGRHLALVLKKNNDRNTFIVMPLTSQANGDGINKIKLDRIEGLPRSIRNNDTYAVFNQIRTVNANRFIILKEGQDRVQVELEKEVFHGLMRLAISDLLHSCNQDEKIEIIKNVYNQEKTIKAINLAYNIISLKKKENNETQINGIENEILDIIKDVPYNLEQKYIDDGIGEIFSICLAKK